VARLGRSIQYDLWIVFAVMCSMLLHAPSMLVHDVAPNAPRIASEFHAGHSHSSGQPGTLVVNDFCCGVCNPAGCGLAPLPEIVLAQLQPAAERAPRIVPRQIAFATFDGHWYEPRGPPLLG